MTFVGYSNGSVLKAVYVVVTTFFAAREYRTNRICSAPALSQNHTKSSRFVR
jgi:hypothetical protein